jgi:hypothetical protein
MARAPTRDAPLDAVPLDSDLWTWERRPAVTEHLGRACVRVEGSGTLAGARITDGALEVELAVGAERGFHGVTWRIGEDASFESFFVRPHQVGNPDAVQYTPVFNGVSGWQLYTGTGFWAPVSFPLGEWFRIRVVFAGDRAEIYVVDLDGPALTSRLRGPVAPGALGLFAGGPPIHVAGFAYEEDGRLPFRGPEPPPSAAPEGVIGSWLVSDAFPESALTLPVLDRGHLAARTWKRLDAEPSGLANLARVNGLRDGRDTVFARAAIRSDATRTTRLELGFSDRAVAYLNGRALYRGDDGYRSRDYRFLGSIGWYDTLFLPLEEGENDLVVAVSENPEIGGGWGVQARLADVAVPGLD